MKLRTLMVVAGGVGFHLRSLADALAYDQPMQPLEVFGLIATLALFAFVLGLHFLVKWAESVS